MDEIGDAINAPIRESAIVKTKRARSAVKVLVLRGSAGAKGSWFLTARIRA